MQDAPAMDATAAEEATQAASEAADAAATAAGEAADAAQAAEEAVAEPMGVDDITSALDPSELGTRLQTFWENNSGLIVNYIVSAIGALLVLFIGYLIAKWVSRIVFSATTRAKLDATLAKFFSKLAKWVILILVFLAVLGMFGINTASFAVVIGAAGLAIGLAFQGTLSNFAAGVMLLVFRPFKVGQVVNVASVFGKVNEIELFTTTIDTFDNRRFILPNSSIFGATIENISFHGQRRVDVNVGVSYSADIDQTREVLTKAAGAIDEVLADPAPAVVLGDLGASSVNWTVRVWTRAEVFWDVKQALTRSIKMHLDEAGISIPFPQMDVHIDGRLAGLSRE
ncbi:MAG: mechanosensitive ion channel domain-containing protein [Planctomycetota bacterium]|nr:mechanosensitive ion channel domain-containing protein [Planctomycetota bacterium]